MAQILVVVASIQMRTLKTDVGKVSVSTVIEHGLVGPEAQRNCVKWGAARPKTCRSASTVPKGNQVKIPELCWDLRMAT